jgi:DNA-binding response OmpR family regulator
MMKILLVDDDQEFTSLLRMELEGLGHYIDTANDGIFGRNLAENNRYDVIILDLMLPGADGRTVCKDIRQQNIHTPVLIISSLDSKEEKTAGLKAGANDYMVKPFRFKELYNNILRLKREYGLEL